MAVVVDTSLAVKWLLLEDDSESARRLLERWRSSDQEVIAPPIFRAEILNALHQRVRQQLLERDTAQELYIAVAQTVAIEEPTGIYALALQLASDFGLPATYDALYLALGQLQRCETWTADRRLAERVRGRMATLHILDEVT